MLTSSFLETLLLADKIKKYNNFWIWSSRTIAITNHAVYDIENYQVKRKILIEDISAIIKTVPPSKNSTEFTLRVRKEYDYRSESSNRDQIIDIIKLLSYLLKNKNLPIYHVNSKDL